MQPKLMLIQTNTNIKIHQDPLGPASSSPASDLSDLGRFPRNKSPIVLLKLLARVSVDQSVLSGSRDLLIARPVSPSLDGDVPNALAASSLSRASL